MARPRKWNSDAERMAAKRVNERINEHVNEHVAEHARQVSASAGTVTDTSFVAFVDQSHVPRDSMAAPWSGSGRGMPREHNGTLYVLVARGTTDPARPEHGVVTLTDWRARLGQRCEHNLAGWSCHSC